MFSSNGFHSIYNLGGDNSGGGSVMLIANSTITGDGIQNDYSGVVNVYACTLTNSGVRNGGNWVATGSIVNSTLIDSAVNNKGTLTMTNSTLNGFGFFRFSQWRRCSDCEQHIGRPDL